MPRLYTRADRAAQLHRDADRYQAAGDKARTPDIVRHWYDKAAAARAEAALLAE